MKTIYRILRISIFFLIITFGFTGCIKKEYYEIGVELDVYNITIDYYDWYWNPSFERYEYVVEFNKITKNVFEKGYVNVQIFVKEKNSDGSEYVILKPLPFVQTYRDLEDDEYKYTETISYDVSPGDILFSIQTSDLWDGDEWLDTYKFKVSIMQ